MSIFQTSDFVKFEQTELSSTADYIIIKSGRDVFGKDCSPWISWYWVHRTRLARAGEEPRGSVVTARNKAAEDLLLLLRDLRIREHESCTQRGTDDTTKQSAPSVGVPLPANHKSDLSGVIWNPWVDGRETLVRVNLLWVFFPGWTSISKNGVDRIGSRRGQMSCWKRSLWRLAVIWNSDDSSGLSHSDG